METSPMMTIGGEKVAAERSFEVLNPATEEPWIEAPECSREQLDEAFAAAASAQRDWASDDTARRRALSGIAAALDRSNDEMARLLTMEQGKTLLDSKLEIEGAVQWLNYYADLEIPVDRILREDETTVLTETRRPLGVVAGITPWNFPIALAAWKVGPALRSGNTLVLKPSPYTPIATLRWGELMQEYLPAGVVNVVSGGDDLGAWMTTHPTPRKVSFTGSVATGKIVAKSAADDLKRLTLELGGNDPAIVLDDADPSKIAEHLFWASFYNNGQVCGCVKRIYVHESRYEDLARRMAAIAEGVRVGDGSDPDSVLGPINNAPQFERVNELLAAAVANGAQVRSGGKPVKEKGYFLPPTILTDVAGGEEIVDEEQFGPVLPLVSYRDLDAVLDEVNRSKYGLASSVWSSDPARAKSVAREIDAGLTWINNHASLTPDVPFGGAKWSGVGVEGGTHGLDDFTQLHVLHESKS